MHEMWLAKKRPTIHGGYETSVHPDMTKMQGMLGAKMHIYIAK